MSERRGRRTDALTRTLRDIEPWETTFPVHSTARFSDSGEFECYGERVIYGSKTIDAFLDCQRGSSRGIGGSQPREIPGGSEVRQSNQGDYTIYREGEPISSRPGFDLVAGTNVTTEVVDDPLGDMTKITLAVAPPSATEPGGITLFEATDNGEFGITLAAPDDLSDNYTQVLPPANGTVALIPTLTRRTTSASAPNGSNTSPSASCLAGEIAVGVGCDWDAAGSSTGLARSRFDSTSQVTCTFWNTSGSTRTVTTQVMCMSFPQ